MNIEIEWIFWGFSNEATGENFLRFPDSIFSFWSLLQPLRLLNLMEVFLSLANWPRMLARRKCHRVARLHAGARRYPELHFLHHSWWFIALSYCGFELLVSFAGLLVGFDYFHLWCKVFYAYQHYWEIQIRNYFLVHLAQPLAEFYLRQQPEHYSHSWDSKLAGEAHLFCLLVDRQHCSCLMTDSFDFLSGLPPGLDPAPSNYSVL